MGTRRQLATQRSCATVDGGPGRLDGVLDVPRDSIHVVELVLDSSFLLLTGCYFPRGRTGIARRKSFNLTGNNDKTTF